MPRGHKTLSENVTWEHHHPGDTRNGNLFHQCEPRDAGVPGFSAAPFEAATKGCQSL